MFLDVFVGHDYRLTDGCIYIYIYIFGGAVCRVCRMTNVIGRAVFRCYYVEDFRCKGLRKKKLSICVLDISKMNAIIFLGFKNYQNSKLILKNKGILKLTWSEIDAIRPSTFRLPNLIIMK